MSLKNRSQITVGGTTDVGNLYASSEDADQPTKSLISAIRTTPKKLKGWRMRVLLCACCSILVFLINLIITIWAAIRYGTGSEGTQILYEGKPVPKPFIN
jgi:hypothetical protein